MNHKWTENKEFVKHDGFYKEFKCNRCGMIKQKWHSKGEFDEYIIRSGISFGFKSYTNYIPECIDWNDNTLD